jgi:hypothetical protein
MLFWQLTIDCREPERLAAFWAEALGWSGVPPAGPETWWALYRYRLGDEDAYDDRLFDPAGLRPPLWFQQVPEEKVGKNRLHLDLYVTGRDASLPYAERMALVEQKVTDLVALGARVLMPAHGEDLPGDPTYFVVLQDPEGNEFCVS